jgi:hypothetical protein
MDEENLRDRMLIYQHGPPLEDFDFDATTNDWNDACKRRLAWPNSLPPSPSPPPLFNASGRADLVFPEPEDVEQSDAEVLEEMQEQLAAYRECLGGYADDDM